MNSRYAALAIVIVLVSYYVGFHSGESRALATIPGNVVNATSSEAEKVNFDAFWKAWNVLKEKYVPSATSTKVATDQDRVWGAIEGLASSLGDPYTVFMPPREAEMFESDIRGNFEGVGMEVQAQNGFIVVVSPLKGSPAEKAGLLAGDRIVKINDKETTSLSTEEAVDLIRGPKGTPVTFLIARASRKTLFEISVIRDVINIPIIATSKLPNGIFKIDLYSFSATSPNLFRGALREFVESKSDKLILDLRGNPGGYLEAAIDMASWFLPSGKVVVRENFGEGKEEEVYRSKGYDVFGPGLKFVILVDGGSASASEILAGALAEQGRATLIGEKTFGKGSVQELVPITRDTNLKVTIARWFTPNGLSISKQGIVPNIEVKRTEEDRQAKKDPQLDRAIEFLTKGQ